MAGAVAQAHGRDVFNSWPSELARSDELRGAIDAFIDAAGSDLCAADAKQDYTDLTEL